LMPEFFAGWKRGISCPCRRDISRFQRLSSLWAWYLGLAPQAGIYRPFGAGSVARWGFWVSP